MTTSFDHMLDKAYRGKSIAELSAADPAALKGVSAADADHLRAAFGIKSIKDLAENGFFRWANAIVAAAGTPNHDPGPPPEWEAFFSQAPLSHFQSHSSGRFRLHFGPVYYRGRLDGSARVLVVGQDPATNEILAHRIFVGRSGQRIQGLFAKIGITRSYVMINTFLYSVFGQFNIELKNISLEPPILNFRNALLDRLIQENRIEAIISVGNGADHAIQNWPGKGSIPVFEITHPSADEAMVLPNWNSHLSGLKAVVVPDEDGTVDPNPYGATFLPADEVAIPRFDLPFGLPQWHGTGGGHSTRDGNDKIVWMAP